MSLNLEIFYKGVSILLRKFRLERDQKRSIHTLYAKIYHNVLVDKILQVSFDVSIYQPYITISKTIIQLNTRVSNSIFIPFLALFKSLPSYYIQQIFHYLTYLIKVLLLLLLLAIILLLYVNFCKFTYTHTFLQLRNLIPFTGALNVDLLLLLIAIVDSISFLILPT